MSLLSAGDAPADLAWKLLNTGESNAAGKGCPMVIYMDDYRKAQESRVDQHRRYDEELMCVNWNPAVSVIAASCYQTAGELSPQLPEDFSTLDAATSFLDRVYALATQV